MTEITRGVRKGMASSLESQAEEMKFNPLVVTDPRYGILEKYPELAKIKEITLYNRTGKVTDREFRNKAIKYMVWLYSSDSLLNSKPVESLVDRKFKAAHLAGFLVDKDSNMFPDRIINDLFELGDTEFVDAVLGFLRFQKQDLWSEIIVSEEQHYEAMQLRLKRVTGSGKSTMEAADLKKKLRLECKELMMDIRSYWDEFWEDHLDLKAVGQDRLYKSIEDRARINTGV